MELDDLNPEQRQAVEHDHGPLLVVAGAGTGKTQVITRRIAHLITQGKAKPSEVLALTFTDKAAREMEERVDQLLPYGVLDTQIMTFHAFGDGLLKEYGADIGLQLQAEVMSKSQQIVFLKSHFDALELEYFAPVGSPDRYLDSLTTYFSRLKEELITPAKYLEFAQNLTKTASDEVSKLDAQKHSELAHCYQVYISQARKAGLLDFSDQISLAIELLERRPNVLASLQQQIKYVLVDEFQDTNLAQNRLLELITGKAGNVMVVGDDDQSIYKFRGAAVSNILQFTEHFPAAKQLVLTQNYRSSQEILDNSYRLIQNNNPDRLEVKNKIDKRLKAQATGPEPRLLTAPSYSVEADTIAQEIKQRIQKGESASDMAILIRKRNQADLIVQALAAQGVPYRLSGRQSLFEQPEILAVLYFLQYLTDPTDSMSLYHLLAGEVYNVAISPLMTAAATARRQNLTLEQLLFAQPTGEAAFDDQIQGFVRQIENWRRLAQEYTVGQLVFDFLQKTDYLDRLTEDSKQNPLLEAKVRNLSRFFGLLGEFERVSQDKSAISYTLNLKALREAGDDPEAGEADVNLSEVQVMTIHKAKGLEFETVYLFDLVKGTFPSNRRRQSLEIPDELLTGEIVPQGDWHLQEERRLMYVAMTRAKTNLVISWSPDHGGILAKKPSPFITEALGIEPPTPESADRLLSPLEQIELFEVKTQNAAPLKPSFMQGDKLYLTPHQIDDYLTCPENFRYLYILQVPQPPQPALMYGSLIHAVINQYYLQKQKGEADLDKLLAMISALWRSDGFLSKGQEERRRQQAEATIKRFVQRADEPPKFSEKEFQVELAEHDVVVRGRFDAVFEDKGQVEIRDFKTSMVEEVGKADDKAKTSVQLAIYALAWQRMTGKLPAKVTLDFVETGQTGAAVKTEADLAKTLADIGKVAAGIRAGDFQRGKSCFYCSHRKVEPTLSS
jgi:DNA helicase II / ATP-dependent DNA helicase PcrA